MSSSKPPVPGPPNTRQIEHFRKLERMYAHALINQEIFQPSIEIADGTSRICQTVRDDFFHGARAVHGSVLFKLLDDAAYFAVSSKITDRFVVTSSFNTYFVRPVATGQITAVGEVVYLSGQHAVADAKVLDDRGREIARGSGTFVRSRNLLKPEFGYR